MLKVERGDCAVGTLFAMRERCSEGDLGDLLRDNFDLRVDWFRDLEVRLGVLSIQRQRCEGGSVIDSKNDATPWRLNEREECSSFVARLARGELQRRRR